MTGVAPVTPSRPPAPDYSPGEGLEWRAVEDPGWTLDPRVIDGYACRGGAGGGGRGCGKPAEAALYRTAFRGGIRGRVPWRYCAEHLYGRWVEDGKVFMWVVRRIGE